MRRAVLMVVVPALLGAGTVAGACAAARAEKHVVEMRGFTFVPARVEVSVGDTIEFVNRDALPHTATAYSRTWDSGEMATSERWSWVATETGEVDYVCAYHPSMRGKIRVVAD